MHNGKLTMFLFSAMLLAGCAQLRPAVQADETPPEEKVQAEVKPDVLPWGRIGARIASGHAGVRVTEVIADSPAAHAGILPNDTILTINQQRFSDVDAAIRYIRSTKPGTKIEVLVYRGGSHMPFTVLVNGFDRDEQLVMMIESAISAQDYARAISLLSLLAEPQNRKGEHPGEKEIERLKNLLPQHYQPE